MFVMYVCMCVCLCPSWQMDYWAKGLCMRGTREVLVCECSGVFMCSKTIGVHSVTLTYEHTLRRDDTFGAGSRHTMTSTLAPTPKMACQNDDELHYTLNIKDI